jgi:GT2 family glycosyltransferase
MQSASSDMKTCALRISVCIVTYKTKRDVLKNTLDSLAVALHQSGADDFNVTVIDNSSEADLPAWLGENCPDIKAQCLSGHGNIGFGRANNLLLGRLGDFHLILNPDVVLEPGSLKNGLAFLAANPDCGLVSPCAFAHDGGRQYLCKRFPAVADLLLRGFAPSWLRHLFRQRLSRYEMQDMPDDRVIWDPPLVSGCFMLFRSPVLEASGGFDPRYMLYFEDFDLSLRVGRISRIAYVPSVRIVHLGGNTASKGAFHIWQFFRSACIFYATSGLRLF